MCLLHLLVPDIVFGQATQVFNKYKYTFEHPDIHEFFPDVVNAFKNPAKQVFLNPVLIGRFVSDPHYIRRLYERTDDSILVQLLLNTQFQNLFKDPQFHALVRSHTQIDALVKKIRQVTPKPREGTDCEPPVPVPSKPTTLAIVSGFGQEGQPGSPLQERFFVEVLDQYGEPFPGATVEFKVTKGGGRVLPAGVRTNNVGRASTTLTLGPEPGVNSVVASVSGITLSQTFTAIATAEREAATLTIESGSDQAGQLGSPLQIIVKVRDQYRDPFPGAAVVFEVKEGGGQLSRTMEHTDRDGQAQVTFTLGSDKGENRVETSVKVEGVSRIEEIFKATAFNADVNNDGVVSIIDLSIVSALRGQSDRRIAGVDADTNGDGVVDIKDMVLLSSALESTAAAPSIHTLVKGGISAADIQVLLTQAKALPEATRTDPVYQRGIVTLEQLLVILTEAPTVPKQTALLVNYPNPFNPETWIPYQLSEASDVTVFIYAVDGRLIRTLVLGHQPAGLYQRKSRAAYWDGRNAFGEPVASGLYFYTLTAGDFTATRKMLIRK